MLTYILARTGINDLFERTTHMLCSTTVESM